VAPQGRVHASGSHAAATRRPEIKVVQNQGKQLHSLAECGPDRPADRWHTLTQDAALDLVPLKDWSFRLSGRNFERDEEPFDKRILFERRLYVRCANVACAC